MGVSSDVADKKAKLASQDRVDVLAAPGALEAGEKVENFADEGSDVYAEALKHCHAIAKQYENQQERADQNEEFWNIYNAKPDANQQYSGNSQCYVPAVRDCINARTKRTLKQLFPTKFRHVEAVGYDKEKPASMLALIEHDIRATQLKDIVRSDLIAGDVTGQWNLYIDWTRSYRRITKLVRRNPILENDELKGIAPEHMPVDPREEEDATEESDVLSEGPEIVDVHDDDVAVVPPTCNDIERASAVSVRLRMSKEKVKELCDEGVFLKTEGMDDEQFWDSIEKDTPDANKQRKDPAKMRAQDAGVKTEGTTKYLLCYEITARLAFDEDGKKVNRLAYIYYTGNDKIRGIVKAPQWGGKRPLISGPAERIKGSFKGRSKVDPVKYMQWNLTDYWNMGQDSAMYSLLPIWAMDPAKNPNWASMVMGLAAVWPIDPNAVKPLTQPQLYKEAMLMCDSIKRQIWESMDVNEIMMGRMPQGRKNNQLMGQMQQEQMTNIMDHAEAYEESMLTPLIERLAEYEYQFRTSSVLVITRGEIGQQAKMERIEPQQFDERYRFQWAGTQIMQSQQLSQMRIAFMNVLRGVPPQQLNGRKVDVTPILEQACEALFGPDVAPKILVDERNLFTVPADVENLMMHNNLPVQIHEGDNDQEHIMAHMQAAQLTGDPMGRFRAHIAAHTMQMQKKMQMQMAQQQGSPGVPGGTASGVPGTPRMGAQPSASPRPGVQSPPGFPHPDQAQGPGRG